MPSLLPDLNGPRVVVVAASRHGATFGIAEAIRNELEAEGVDATLFVADSFESFEGADAVVLGSAVYMGHWLDAAESLLNRYSSQLAAVPVWLFSSGPVGDEEAGDHSPPPAIERAAERIQARDNKVFAGRIDHASLGFGERMMLKALSVEAEDSRDWDEIAKWSRSIAAELNEAGRDQVPQPVVH